MEPIQPPAARVQPSGDHAMLMTQPAGSSNCAWMAPVRDSIKRTIGSSPPDREPRRVWRPLNSRGRKAVFGESGVESSRSRGRRDPPTP
jgi:hypothetical protein